MPEQVADAAVLEHAEYGPHIEPKKIYFAIWIILLGFTGLTTGVAFIDLGMWNTPVALAIAVIKASLVVIFFMHARHSEKLVRVVIGVAIFWLLILIVVTVSDYATRGLLSPTRWMQNQPVVVHHLTPGPVVNPTKSPAPALAPAPKSHL